MTTLEAVQTWRGMKMVDADGEKIGTIEDILLDRKTGEPAWAAVKPGLFGLSASLSAVSGGAFRFEIQPGQFCEGAYVEVRPPTFVSFTWGWTDPVWNLPPASSLVSVELTAATLGTRVRLTHSRLPGELRAIHDEGWSTFLARLLAVTAACDLPAYPPEGRP